MATVEEQAIEWLRGLKSMQDSPAFFEEALALVPTIPQQKRCACAGVDDSASHGLC